MVGGRGVRGRHPDEAATVTGLDVAEELSNATVLPGGGFAGVTVGRVLAGRDAGGGVRGGADPAARERSGVCGAPGVDGSGDGACVGCGAVRAGERRDRCGMRALLLIAALIWMMVATTQVDDEKCPDGGWARATVEAPGWVCEDVPSEVDR